MFLTKYHFVHGNNLLQLNQNKINCLFLYIWDYLNLYNSVQFDLVNLLYLYKNLIYFDY